MHEQVVEQVDDSHVELEERVAERDEVQRCLDCGELRLVCRCWPGEG